MNKKTLKNQIDTTTHTQEEFLRVRCRVLSYLSFTQIIFPFQEPFLYANDTALITSHKNVEELEKKHWNRCQHGQTVAYSQENDLVLNKVKTAAVFGTRKD